MAECPECGASKEHEPEECPAAEWFTEGGTNGACEHWFLSREWDGMVLSVMLQIGEISLEDYYRSLAVGVQEMHDMSMCGA